MRLRTRRKLDHIGGKNFCRYGLEVLLIGALFASGCAAPFGVRRVSPEEVHRTLTGTVLSTGKLSNFTRIQLRRQNLEHTQADHPEAAIATLHARLSAGQGEHEQWFSLAELSFAYAEHTRSKPYYLAAAIYAYTFLFSPEGEAHLDVTDPRLRTACDLYNRAITEAFKSSDGKTVIVRGGTYDLPFGHIDIAFDQQELIWARHRLVDFLPAAELEVWGLHNRYRQAGIGAPMAARIEPLDPDDPDNGFLLPNVRVPATVVLTIDASDEPPHGGTLKGRLDVYTEAETTHVRIDDQEVPLELEPTAAMGAMLNESRAWERELNFFLGAALSIKRPSLLMAREPYQPGKIPVVFVHGTASSPARWADMVNDLDNDPVIHQHFQIWVFTYDSGNAIAYSAMLLRRALTQAVERFDPEGRDACLRDMVVIGHSQGGLLTKMTVIDSGSRFWDNLSSTPFEQASMSEQTRALLQEGLFVKPLPFVKRVIFIATPHRGSYLAGPGIVRRLAARLISMPSSLVLATADLVKIRNGARDEFSLERVPTSIDNMSPGQPFIRTLAAIPVAPGVAAHSIIAVEGNGPKEEGGDGVVKYTSAHIDGVESELVVNSSHSCQSNPDTINEVQRILRLHLEQDPCAAAPDQPQSAVLTSKGGE
jgi:pimeloyl-ACP methyl ester carboxylesterase